MLVLAPCLPFPGLKVAAVFTPWEYCECKLSRWYSNVCLGCFVGASERHYTALKVYRGTGFLHKIGAY